MFLLYCTKCTVCVRILPLADDFMPALRLGQTADEDDIIFNDITIDERKARIDSIIRLENNN